MKTMYKFILAGLFSSAAFVQAQISSFEVSSLSGPDNNVQVAGVIVSTTSVLGTDTSSPNPWFHNFTQVWQNFYSLQAGVGGTVLSFWPDIYTPLTTRLENFDLNGNPASYIVNCSGRFRAVPGYTTWEYVWIEDYYYGGYYEWQEVYHEGTPGYLTFTVSEGANFSLDVLGQALNAYGLNGLQAPIGYIYGGPNTTYWAFYGEGSTNLGYLQPGTYTAVVNGEDNTAEGIVLASINKQ